RNLIVLPGHNSAEPSWRTHSCVPGRDSSRPLCSRNTPSVGRSADAARTSAYATVVLFVLSPLALHAQKAVSWSEFLGDPSGSHYSPLKQLNTSNVNQLEIAWSYETGDDLSYTFCPLVVDNIAYVAAKEGALVALDATTGK